MEKKSKKKTIDTAIYILIGAMLLCMLLVAVLTATLRRGEKNPNAEVTSGESSDTTADSGKAETTGKESETKRPVETSARDTEKSSPSAVTKPAEEVPVSVGIRYYVLPVDGTVSKAFEVDVPVYSMTMNDYRAHTGVDLAADVGSEVVSVEKGTVCRVWNDPMMGKCVSVDHGDGIVSSYMNLSEELASGIDVGVGVVQGQPLGAVGETSLTEIAEEPHLHLEMKVGGELVDPIEYMGIEGADADYEG